MNRFSRAWYAFCNQIEPFIEEESYGIPVIGEASVTKLYRVDFAKPQKKPHGKKAEVRKLKFSQGYVVARTGDYTYDRANDDRYEIRYYTTCDAANAANPNACVTQVDAVQIGDAYLPVSSLKLVEAIKPKVAKGRRA